MSPGSPRREEPATEVQASSQEAIPAAHPESERYAKVNVSPPLPWAASPTDDMCVQGVMSDHDMEYLETEEDVPSNVLAEFKDRFMGALRRWYKVWLLIGWAWPVAAMIVIYSLSQNPIVLVSLLVFGVTSFGVFLPVLRLRVCPRCKANELGICPFFPPKPLAETR